MKQKRLSKKQLARRGQLHKHRLSWFSILLIGLLTIQVIYNFQYSQTLQVLAYAVNVNQGDLLAVTNQKRAENGLASLNLSAKLNNAAHAKAQHMIDNNYWSHNAPDGTTPWSFFTNAGYDFEKAGENLAYGFADSTGIVNGWMNSVQHRANILGSYNDVGFGFASGPSYQGSENTVIVAFYGTAQGAAPAAPPAPAAPVAVPPPAPAPKPTPSPVATPQPTPEPPKPVPAPTAPTTPEPTQVAAQPAAAPKVTQTAAPKKVDTLQAVLSGQANWSIYASLGLIGAVSSGFAATHMAYMRRMWVKGERWMLVHPAFDAGIILTTLGMILSTTYQFIR